MNKHDLANAVIEKLWALIGDERVAGLSPYEAARKMGLLDESAKIVDELWDGPRPLPNSTHSISESKCCVTCAGKGYILPLGSSNYDAMITCGVCQGAGSIVGNGDRLRNHS